MVTNKADPCPRCGSTEEERFEGKDYCVAVCRTCNFTKEKWTRKTQKIPYADDGGTGLEKGGGDGHLESRD